MKNSTLFISVENLLGIYLFSSDKSKNFLSLFENPHIKNVLFSIKSFMSSPNISTENGKEKVVE
jgi:hypothetical protein